MSICFTDGVCLYGAFAKKKAEQRKGRVKFVNIRGSWRYVVISRKRKSK